MSDTDMTKVADAIRTKAGSSESLAFPDGFVSAVEGITTGEGGAGVKESVWSKAIGNYGSRPLNEAVEITEDSWGEFPTRPSEIKSHLFQNACISKIFVPKYITNISGYNFDRLFAPYDDENHPVPTEFEFEASSLSTPSNPGHQFQYATLGGWPGNLICDTVGGGMFIGARIIGDTFEIPEGVTQLYSDKPLSVNFFPEDIYYNYVGDTSRRIEGRVILPASMTSMNGAYNIVGGFDNDASLITLELRQTEPPVINASIFQTYTPKKIIVPAGTLDAYKTATNWSQFADIMEEATE